VFHRNERHHYVRGTFCGLSDVSLALVPADHEHTLHSTRRVSLGSSAVDTCVCLALPYQILFVTVVIHDVVIKRALKWPTNKKYLSMFSFHGDVYLYRLFCMGKL
jgi:hypothetical protein